MYKNFDRIVMNIKNCLQARNLLVNLQGSCFQFSQAPSKAFDRIQNATISDRYIFLKVENDKAEFKEYKYPSIWLRDNCQCPECFHDRSKSRIIDWQKFSYEVVPKRVELSNKLRVVWSDDHFSNYDLKWLKERSFNAEDQDSYLNTIYKPRLRLWGRNDFEKVIESFQFQDIVNTKEGLKSWLESLAINGCAMINGAPLTGNECRQIANLVGFIKRTHYGEEFVVRAKEGTSNVAYLSAPLQIHTDLPYYEYKPGVNLLHCLVQTKSPGAFNLLVDGFYIAGRMKNEHPNCYDILTKTLVNWSDYGSEDGNQFHSVYRDPVICLDLEGNLKRINHSVPQRDSFFSVEPGRVDEWYQAMTKFVQMLQEEAFPFKTKPGDILTFSNIRLLHGRTGYTDEEGNTRHLIGAYLDWDEMLSRLRVLSETSK